MPTSKRHKQRQAKLLASREVFRGPVFRVTTDTVLEPGGIQARRDIVRHPGSVVILALDETQRQPRVLLERQYRHAAAAYLWELPAGRVDPGESEIAAAKRELLEETGFTAARWQRLFKCFVSPGFMDETMAIYLARELRPGKAQPEADERIRQRMVPLVDALQMILNGTIRDGKTISAILWIKVYALSSKPRH